MRFTLTYDGPLHAVNDKNKRTPEKVSIRKRFHHQLVDQWNSHPVLRHDFLNWVSSSEEQRQQNRKRLDILIRYVERGACRFIPLVSRDHHMNCEIDILFLRRDPITDSYLVNSAGDLDNRLKGLFDALSIPSVVPPTARNPQEGATFVLMEDDKLLTGLSVRSDRLLEDKVAYVEGHENPSFVRLVLGITVKVHQVSPATIGLIGDW
jgi:hypothetical protein